MQELGVNSGWRQDLWGFLLLGVCLLVCIVRLPFVEEKGRPFLLYALAIVVVATGCQIWTVYRRRSRVGRSLKQE
jgi:uncharacterized membrane protein HdeD (DUF308 family)